MSYLRVIKATWINNTARVQRCVAVYCSVLQCVAGCCYIYEYVRAICVAKTIRNVFVIGVLNQLLYYACVSLVDYYIMLATAVLLNYVCLSLVSQRPTVMPTLGGYCRCCSVLRCAAACFDMHIYVRPSCVANAVPSLFGWVWEGVESQYMYVHVQIYIYICIYIHIYMYISHRG